MKRVCHNVMLGAAIGIILTMTQCTASHCFMGVSNMDTYLTQISQGIATILIGIYAIAWATSCVRTK